MYVLPLEILEGRSPSEAASSEAASSERPPRNPSLLVTALGGGLLRAQDLATLPLGLVLGYGVIVNFLGWPYCSPQPLEDASLIRGNPLGYEGRSGGAFCPLAFTLGRAGTA